MTDDVERGLPVELADDEVLRLTEAEELGRPRILRDERSVRGVLVARDDDVTAQLRFAGDQDVSRGHDEAMREGAERGEEDPAHRTSTGRRLRDHVSTRRAESLIA